MEVSRAANPLPVKGQLGSSDICTLAVEAAGPGNHHHDSDNPFLVKGQLVTDNGG